MRRMPKTPNLMVLLLLMLIPLCVSAESTNEDDQQSPETVNKALPEVLVVSRREEINAGLGTSLSELTTQDLATVQPTHPNEIFSRIAGAWVSEGSGQEHLTAIRSPVLTGAGACGAFMVLEDDVPTRPSGFCNVNQLFELNIAQAGRIDVLRGPGTVTYGSNALHGVINVRTPGPASLPLAELAIEAGTDAYYRGSVALSGAHSALQANYTDSDSFRDGESYTQGLVNVQLVHDTGNAVGRTSFAYANLDQKTAGYILGKNTYKNNSIRRLNFNPGAFRDAWAARLSSRWDWLNANGSELELIPFIRSSRMDFLQHFLPGTPLEHNGQDSAGLMFSWAPGENVSAGVDLEWVDGTLTEYQENPVDSGSAFLRETRPQGFHYDYKVKAVTTAAWFQWKTELSPLLNLNAGLRTEHLAYDYNNKMLDGNTRDDGSACGFGGCLYTRPADRNDSFTNFSPELGLGFAISEGKTVYLRAARGFRAPQATELYRLQSGQRVADLDSEILNSVELGIKSRSDDVFYEFVVYRMQKHNFIFRDAEGYNVSNGRTSHTGIESAISFQVTEYIDINANLSWAKHRYDFNRNLGRGEVIIKGNEVDTAPRWLAGVRVHWRPSQRFSAEAEWVYQGGYFLDAANEHRYPGHNLVNLRSMIPLGRSQHAISLRLTNLLDVRYAERADYAFGNYRYFPGAGRRINLEWAYRFQ